MQIIYNFASFIALGMAGNSIIDVKAFNYSFAFIKEGLTISIHHTFYLLKW